MTIGELEQRISKLMHEKEILLEREREVNKEIVMGKERELEWRSEEVVYKRKVAEVEKELATLRSKLNDY